MQKEVLMYLLTTVGSPLCGCRVKTYDGAANQREELNGCQALIKSQNPIASYFPCRVHSCTLVARGLSECCAELSRCFYSC